MKKKLLSLLFTSLLFVGVSTVKASTDINDWTVTVEAETGTAGAVLTMTVDGEFEEDYYYYAMFVNEGDEKPSNAKKDVQNYEIKDSSNVGRYNYINRDDKKIIVSYDWYLYKGYDYVYFFKCNSLDEVCEMSESPVKLLRPELPKLDQRYSVSYYKDDFSIGLYPYFPYINTNKNAEKTYVLKIGLIKDKELLYSLYKKQSGALEKLLEYAEETEDRVYELKKEPIGTNRYKIDRFDIVDGGYYYIYTTFKDEEGVYRDLRGVSLAIGNSSFLSNDIEWSFDDEETDSSVTVDEMDEEKFEKNPSTADTNIALILGALVVCGSLIVIGKKKINAK